MNLQESAALLVMLAGCVFYLAGTVGLLRFPDVFCRLHALTKADNIGLLLMVTGLAILNGQPRVASMLLLIWMVGLLAATVSAHLIARHADGNRSSKQQDARRQ